MVHGFNPEIAITVKGAEGKMRVELIGELKPETLAYLHRLAMEAPKTVEEYHAFNDLSGKIFWMDDLELNG